MQLTAFRERIATAISMIEEENQESGLAILREIHAEIVAAPDSFSVKKRNKTFVLNVEDVIAFKAEEKYVVIYHKTGDFLFDASLSKLEQMYKNFGFLRVHRSWLVNSAFIVCYETGKVNFLKLKESDITPIISRRYLPTIKELLR